MCDFHLQGNCFHPEKVDKGFVASPCNVHDCLECTNFNWQQKKIEEELIYYNAILKLTEFEDQKPLAIIMQTKSKNPIDVSKEKRFKNPFKLFTTQKDKAAEEQ